MRCEQSTRFCLICLSLSLVVLPVAKAQERTELEDEVLEQLMEGLDESVDISEFTERLRYFLKRPIDLNKTKGEDLAQLLVLSPLQIEALLRHREISRQFISILELQGITGFDPQTIQKIEPFIRVYNDSFLEDVSLREMWKRTQHDLMLRYGRTLEPQKGYQITDPTRSRYLGDANKYLIRYRMNYSNKLRLAINMKKDAGEPFFKEEQRAGFDHYGVSLAARDLGPFREIVVGDFAMQVGQGLVSWNGMSFGKGAMVSSSARQGLGLRSYSSTNEHNYLRGVAAKLGFANFELTPFVSWRKLSGNVSLLDGERQIKTISESGLHRTPTEQRYRNAIGQFSAGLEAAYKVGRLHLGLVGLFNQFDGRLSPDNSRRNVFAFRGAENTNIGFNYNYTYRNVYLYGETATQLQGGWATNNGIIGSIGRKLSAFLNYRNYQKNYYAAFAQSLSESTGVNNEQGVYTGLVYHPSRTWEWISYVDYFKFPWARYRVDAPSSGIDVLSQVKYTWYKVGALSLRYRHRLKEENQAATAKNPSVTDILKQQLQLSFKYKLDKQWEIRSRLDGVTFLKDGKRDYGFLAYQDVFWKPVALPLQLNMRLAIFHTDSYDARLYAYENDVLYASSFPLYNNKGIRSYLNLRYRMGRKLDLWARYAMSKYKGVEKVGSGLDESGGSKRSDVKLQVRYQW